MCLLLSQSLSETESDCKLNMNYFFQKAKKTIMCVYSQQTDPNLFPWSYLFFPEI